MPPRPSSDDALITDPYAAVLVEGAGTGPWTTMLDEKVVEKAAAIDPEVAAIFRHMRNYQAVRTHFFDEHFTKAAAAGIRQIVILASGLDSRAYRIEWPDGHHGVRDRPAQGAGVQGRDAGGQRCASRRRRCTRCRWICGMTGRQRCARTASMPAQPTAWLAEGLLMYLPADAQDRLFELITELSAPGSRIAAETVGVHSDERRAQMQERFEKIADELGIEREFDVQELMYNDPDRADVAEWLSAHGWRADAVTSQDEMRRLGRFVELADADDDAFATFVTAERL